VRPLLQWINSNYYATWVCVFLAFGTQRAMRMRRIVICGLSGCKTFFHIISQTKRFKKNYWTQNLFWFYLQLLSETFLILKRNERDVVRKMRIGLHVQYALLLSDFNWVWIFSTDSEKSAVIKFHENLCGDIRVRFRRTDGQTDGNARIIAAVRSLQP